jgi:hypothetical protein
MYNTDDVRFPPQLGQCRWSPFADDGLCLDLVHYWLRSLFLQDGSLQEDAPCKPLSSPLRVLVNLELIPFLLSSSQYLSTKKYVQPSSLLDGWLSCLMTDLVCSFV